MTEPIPRPISGIPGSGGCVVPASRFERYAEKNVGVVNSPMPTDTDQLPIPGVGAAPDAARGMRWLGLAANSLQRAELGTYEVDNALGQIAAATPIVDAYVRSSDRKSVVMDNLYSHSLRLAQLHGRTLGGEHGVQDKGLIRDLQLDTLTALNLMQDPAQLRERPIT